MPSKPIKHEKKKGAIYRFEKIRERLNAFDLLKYAKSLNKPVKVIKKNHRMEQEIYIVNGQAGNH